jgi:hypothetical protein
VGRETLLNNSSEEEPMAGVHQGALLWHLPCGPHSARLDMGLLIVLLFSFVCLFVCLLFFTRQVLYHSSYALFLP